MRETLHTEIQKYGNNKKDERKGSKIKLSKAVTDTKHLNRITMESNDKSVGERWKEEAERRERLLLF